MRVGSHKLLMEGVFKMVSSSKSSLKRYGHSVITVIRIKWFISLLL